MDWVNREAPECPVVNSVSAVARRLGAESAVVVAPECRDSNPVWSSRPAPDAESAVGGAVAFGLISSSSGPMIGASGAAFGLFGVWQCWDYGFRKRRKMPVRPVIASVLALIFVNVLLCQLGHTSLLCADARTED